MKQNKNEVVKYSFLFIAFKINENSKITLNISIVKNRKLLQLNLKKYYN